MNIKLASLLTVVAITAITARALIYLQAPTEEVQEGGFGIYLLENDELVISDNDIVWYDKTSHEIKLTEEGVEKIKAIERDVYGIPFVVKLDNKVIYTGSFWTRFSSIAWPGVVIEIDNAKTWGVSVLKIELGYPSSDFFVGTDPRNNSEIFDYFQKIGKLIQ